MVYKPKHQVVIRAGQDAAEAVGKKFGAYVMTTARRSLGRKRKDGKPSEPGKPPRAGSAFRKSILFAYDPADRATVIGAVLLPGKATKDAPEALERGKTTARTVLVSRRRRKKTVTYRPRPFMVPALEKRISDLPELWRGAIHR